MSWSCPKCATSSPDEGRFCGNCGYPRPATVPPAHPWIGKTVLGRYRIVSVIGEGAMGTVYRAEQRMGTTARPVAIKVLHAELTSDAGLRARFLRECELVVQLEHPNTIKFYDFGDLDDGSLAIVMEFVDGESLGDRVDRGPVSPSVALHIVGQICGSLHEAHSRGIIHRDLKPENILLTSRAGQADVVKVCDFGIAKQEGIDTSKPALTMQGTVVGTPPYMSPEQIASGDLDARSDIYSLGVLTYELLTGEYPWTDVHTVFEWAQCHLHKPPTPIDAHPIALSMPPRARAMIMRALAKSRDDRPATVLEFARELIGRDHMEVGWGLSTIRPPAASRSVAETAVMQSSAGVAPGAPGFVPSSPGLTPSPPPIEVPMTSHVGLRTPPPYQKERSGGMGLLVILALALGALSSLAVFYFFFYEADEPVVADPLPLPSLDAGARVPVRDPGTPAEWLRIVRRERGSSDPSLATGAPDGRTATIPQGSSITLELISPAMISTDGQGRPDLHVEVAEDSGPYRVDVAQGNDDSFRTVVSDAAGTQAFDLDQYRLSRTRSVRISGRGRRPVKLDAVGVFLVADL